MPSTLGTRTRGGAGHAPRAHAPNQRLANLGRGTRPSLGASSGSLADPAPICAGAVCRPCPIALQPAPPAANMAAPCVSCGAAASYRLFLAGRVSFAREQGLWKAAAAGLQTGTRCQVRLGKGGSAGPCSTRCGQAPPESLVSLRIFSCWVRDRFSCGICGLVPWPEIEPRPPALGDGPVGY